jgi:hypothetical protein
MSSAEVSNAIFWAISQVYVVGKDKGAIINRLESVAGECGDFAPVVLNVAQGLDTGRNTVGGKSERNDEVDALCTLARMLEAKGNAVAGLKLVLIAKTIANLEKT